MSVYPPSRLKRLIKDWLPPALLQLLRASCVPWASQGVEFGGNYASWKEASAQAQGYAADNIFEKARLAMLKVKHGQAACERDTVLFDRIEYSYPLLAHLLHVAGRNAGKLTVLDFGGALGSSYFQNRGYLAHLQELHWMVVEQPHFVACGKAELADSALSFHDGIEAAAAAHKPDLILLSSVLQYLENPADIVRTLMRTGAPAILVDRAPVLPDSPSRLTVQNVPPSIYAGSYPCWLFNEQALIHLFEPQYRLVDQFDASIGGAIAAGSSIGRYRGYLFNLS